MQPFTTVDEAWEALLAQRISDQNGALDLVEHAFQTAEGLERLGADDELVAAGLLHDLGDGRVSAELHAPWAADLVRPLLGERVAWLIGAHADAKRYLCSTDLAYWETLSPVSQQTMIEQGGLMPPEEVAVFASNLWAEDALALRRCDDGGKRRDHKVANPERFKDTLARVARVLA